MTFTPGINFIDQNSEFKYAWNVYIPKELKSSPTLLLWGYSSPPYDDYDKAKPEFNYQLNRIKNHCDKHNFIALSIFLPRKYNIKTYPDFKFDAMNLTQETMVEGLVDIDDFYKRADIEVLKIIDLVKFKLKTQHINIKEKLVASGISSGALFANRISLLYPDLFSKIALFIAGDFIYPIEEINNFKIDYPFGTNNLSLIYGNRFNAEKFRNIDHYIYVGEKDENDPLPYEVAFSDLIDKYKNAVGKTVLERTRLYSEFLDNNGNNVQIRIEPNIAHEVTSSALEEGFLFLGNSK